MAKETQVKTGVSPSLHPAVISSIPGYEQNKGYCGGAEEAFNIAYKTVEDVIATRKTVQVDESRTPKAKALAVANKAEQYLARLQKTHGAAWERLDNGIKHIETQLSAPLEQQAGAGSVNGEIRSHAKSLKRDERMRMIEDALKRGDVKTCGAILGAPAYLSGLNDEEHKHFTRKFHEATNPELVSRLNVITQVKQKLEQSKDIIKMELERAVGLSPIELQRLREGSKAAEDALLLKDFAPAQN